MVNRKILVATKKPFHSRGVKNIKKIFQDSSSEVEFLEKYSDPQEIVERLKGKDALIVRSDKVTRDIIDAADNLKIIVRAGAGYDNIDLEAASERGIVVMNTPGQNANAVAELVFGMLIYFIRNKFAGNAGFELWEKTLGIHAYGNVGRYVAEIGKGFGMDVYAYDPFVPPNLMKKDGINPISRPDKLYRQCQFISVHIPANEKTLGSINYNLMSHMPEDAFLVNTARTEIIHENDLLRILKDREDFHYLADVAPSCRDTLESEYGDRCFFTQKKMGAQTVEANINAGMAAADQILDFFEEGDTTFQVNK